MKRINLFTLLVASLLFLTQANAQWGWNGITGDGPIVKKTLDLDDLSGIKLSLPGNVYLTQGSTQSVVVESHQNIIDDLKRSVRGKTWNIECKQNVKKVKTFNVYITIPNLHELSIAGAGNIYTENEFKSLDDLTLSVAGSGDLRLFFETQDLKCDIAGSGKMDLAGSSEKARISIAGSGDVRAYDLEIKKCKVTIAGSGSVNVHVKDNLKANIAGSGDINYKGDPNLDSTIMGSGNISSKGK